MAIGDYDNLKIYDTLMQTAANEIVARNLNAFNAASNGALVLSAQNIPGYFSKKSFFKRLGAITRRDPTDSTTGLTDVALTQGNTIGCKRFTKFTGSQVADALRDMGLGSWEEFAVIIGEQYGEEKVKAALDACVIAAEACTAKAAGSTYDHTAIGAGTLIHGALANGLSKMGDRSDRIVCWVMHSKPYFDLVGQAISDKITNIADGVILTGGLPSTLGRPVVVTDSAALYDANGSLTDTYNTLGLTRGAVEAMVGSDTLFAGLVSGVENVIFRYQADSAYMVAVEGFAYDVATVNPSDGNLGDSTKWTSNVSDVKAGPGVVVISK